VIQRYNGVSQPFDYFACTRPQGEQRAEALASGDEDLQQQIEATMPGSVKLKNLSQNEFNLLPACVARDAVDVVEAVGQVDLVEAVYVEEGPWARWLWPARRRSDCRSFA
jgi:hypothetical protein